ncbi:MAG: autotransporter domain-containing protein [Chlamydiae bacterium]|nr:autotransporter domain-containing protein [Chlamydiota bacterium]
MSFRNKIASLALLSIPYTAFISAACPDGTWTGHTNSAWTNAGNWVSCIPNLAGDTANFGSGASTNTVSINANPIALGFLNVNSPTSYTFQPIGGGTLQFSGASPAISILQGQHLLTTPIASTNPISFFGPGQLTTENNTITLTGSDLTINSGTLVNLNTSVVLIPGNIGSDIAAQDVNLSGGTLNNINHGSITGHSASGCQVTGTNFTMNGGALTIFNDANTFSGGIGSQVQMTGAITINGGVVTNTNTGTINGNNGVALSTHGGPFTINGGTVLTSNSGTVNSGDVTAGLGAATDFIINGGTVIFSNSGTVNTSVACALVPAFNSGNFTINGGTLSFINSGTINGGVGCALVLNNPASNYIMNGGLVTLSNTGAVSPTGLGCGIKAFTMFVNGGVLVNDAIVAANTLTIGESAVVAGSGTFIDYSFGSTTQIVNSGSVIPGAPAPSGIPGTMTIKGSYTQTSSGTLVINLLNDSSFSQLSVTNTASLAGSLEVAVTPGFSITPGSLFPIVQANGGVSGTFANLINFNLPPTLRPQVEYFSNSAVLFFTPGIGKYVKLAEPLFSSINQTNIRLEKQMEKMRMHFPEPNTPKPSPRKKAYASRSEDLPIQLAWHPIPGQSRDPNTQNNKPMKEHETVLNVEEEKTQRLTESLQQNQERPWNFYIGPKGQIGNVVSKEDTQGYKQWSAGAFTGFDYVFSEAGLGLLIDYERFEAHVGKDWGKFTINDIHASIYSTYAPKQLSEFSLQGILGGGYEFYSIDRSIGNAQSQIAKGNPRGLEFDALLGVEYAFRKSGFTSIPTGLQIIPLASVQYIHLTIDGYKEHNAETFDLTIQRQKPKSLRTNLGMRINYDWQCENVSFSPELTMSWQREFLDKEYKVAITPTQFKEFGFSVEIPKSGRNIALAGVDLLVTLFDRHGLEAGYDFEYNSLYHTHFLYMSYNVRF